MLRNRWSLVGVGLAAATLLLIAHASTAGAAEPDLTWSPKPFAFESGASVRYIDFASGRDASPGTKERPWKHHPWDKKATGEAAACKGVHTYCFKKGVVYRGALVAKKSGKPGGRFG